MDRIVIINMAMAVNEVFIELLGDRAKLGECMDGESSVKSLGFIAMVTLLGKLKGKIVIDVSAETAHAIAKKIMHTNDIDPSDSELIKSATGELLNTITGKTITALNNLGIQVDISPPTIFTGKGMEISNIAGKCYSFDITTGIGLVRLNLYIDSEPVEE